MRGYDHPAPIHKHGDTPMNDQSSAKVISLRPKKQAAAKKLHALFANYFMTRKQVSQ
jgi:hypothetical protein